MAGAAGSTREASGCEDVLRVGCTMEAAVSGPFGARSGDAGATAGDG